MGLSVVTYALSKKYAKEYTDTVVAALPKAANLNLLTNPDFSINQRGETIYTGTADEYTYTVDRWRIKGEGSTFNTETKEVSLVANGVFEQYVEMPVYLRGNYVTATFKVSEYSGEISVGTADMYSLITSPTTTFTTQVPSDVGGIKVSFINMSGSTVTFKPVFVKLEVGQNSTPLSPLSIAEELIKCQRYYKKWLTDGNMDIYRGNATSSISVDLIMPTFSMRTVPTVTYSNLYAPCSGHADESSPAITGVSSVQSDTDCTVITFDTSDQSAFAGYSLQIRGGGYLALDSEVMADILLDLSTTLTGCTLVISDGVDTYKVGSNVISKDTELTITAIASEGYTLDGMTFTVNGVAFTNGSTHTVTENVEIIASAVDVLLDLSATLTGCTLVISDGVDTYEAGSNVIPKDTQLTITATASEGYTLDGMTFTVDGVEFINGSTTSPITANISIVATASLLALPGDYVLGDYYDIEDSDSPTISWERAHIDIEDKFYTLNYSFDGGDPTDLVVKGYLEAMGSTDVILKHGAHDPIIFADQPTLVETDVFVLIFNGVIDENKVLTPSDTVTTLILYNQVPGEGEAPSPNLGKIVSINSLEATVMQDLVITATDCTVKVVDHRDNSIEFLEGTGTLPTSYKVDFIITPAEGYTADGMTFEVNGVAFDPLNDTLIVPAETVTITATAAEVLVQPFTIPGDYALGDRDNEDEMFKDSFWEAEHMDILDQWYTLTYSFDGGPSSTALLKGMPDVDMGFGEMDIMVSPTGDMSSLADEQVAVIILNAVVTPGDGTPGGGNMSITPSELVTTLVLNNNVDGGYGEPSPITGKIVSLTSLVASEMNDLVVTATNCTVSVVEKENSELVLEEGTDTLPTGLEVAFQITPTEGYTTDGMTFLVNGVATDITSSLVVSGDVTITANAIALDLPLVGEIDFSTATWDGTLFEVGGFVVSSPELDFSSITDGAVNLKINYTLDGVPASVQGTKSSTEDYRFIVDLPNGANGPGIGIPGDYWIVAMEGLNANTDILAFIAPETFFTGDPAHTFVLNSIEVDNSITEILSADIEYVYDSIDTFDGSITSQTLDVSSIIDEQANVYTYWDIDGALLLIQPVVDVTGTTITFNSITLGADITAQIVSTDGVLTTEITGIGITGTEVIKLLAVFVDSNI